MTEPRKSALDRLRSRLSSLRRAAPSPTAVVDRLRTADPAGTDPEDKTEGEADGADDAAQEPAPPADALTARLTTVCWQHVDGAVRLQITGFAWRRAGQARGSEVTAVSLRSGSRAVEAALEPISSDSFNDFSRYRDRDRAGAGFRATVDAADLLPTGDRDRVTELTWTVTLTVGDVDGEVTDTFSQRDEGGSAGQFNSCDVGAGCLALASWEKPGPASGGLTVTVSRRHVQAEELSLDGTELDAVIVCRGSFVPTSAVLTRGGHAVSLTLDPDDNTDTASPPAATRRHVHGSVAELLDVADSGDAARSWYLQLGDDQGRRRHVHWSRGAAPQDDVPGFRAVSRTDPRLAIRYGPNGVIRLDLHRRRLVVESVEVDADPAADGVGPQLQVDGECHGLPEDPDRWQLVGTRHRFAARQLTTADGRFRAVFALTAAGPWARNPTALPSGDYRLQVALAATDEPDSDDDAAAQQAQPSPALLQDLPSQLRTADHRITARRAGGGSLELRIEAPRSDGERSRLSHYRFEIMHRTERIAPTDTILFDSFDGKTAGDNALAVHDELRRRRPDLQPLWTVVDHSVEVPEGSERLIIKSEAWWRALTSSRLVVTNCWLPQKFTRRDHQTVLQTWHGTPLKLLGFDRIGTKRGDEYRQRTLREVAQWSLLISQNPYSSRAFRSAYGYQGEVLEIGYPRDDILSTADDQRRADIRRRLGLTPDETVVLYVPTWRENAKGLFRQLDFAAVAASFGGHGRLLIRGHANTIKHGGSVSGDGMLDVTLYPDLADLYLVADAMITDYSSTMFDYSITGKPMIFFAPDIEQYTGKLRGTYFDLSSSAPGPILTTTDEVIDALSDLAGIGERYRTAYDSWQQKFNPYDDGEASRRAVDALLARDAPGQQPFDPEDDKDGR